MSVRPVEVYPTVRAARMREFYLAYLNSAEWRARRNRRLQQSGYRCERCPAKRNLNVHHKTYERLGAELDSDLEVLCVDCHEGEHFNLELKSDHAIYVKLASSVIQEHPFQSVADLSEEVKRRCVIHKIDYDAARVHRALELLTGTRLSRVEPKRTFSETPPDSMVVSDSEAHEVLSRLRVATGLEFGAKAMPTSKTAAEQEVIITAQMAECRRFELPKRKSVRQRLEDIFARSA